MTAGKAIIFFHPHTSCFVTSEPLEQADALDLLQEVYRQTLADGYDPASWIFGLHAHFDQLYGPASQTLRFEYEGAERAYLPRWDGELNLLIIVYARNEVYCYCSPEEWSMGTPVIFDLTKEPPVRAEGV